MQQIMQLLSVLRAVWRDPRVPMLARIYVVIAPFYWINPFHLIPDFQPTGHCDDLIISCLLLVMAFRLVPAAVFRDARKVANPALCAAVCLSWPLQARAQQTIINVPNADVTPSGQMFVEPEIDFSPHRTNGFSTTHFAGVGIGHNESLYKLRVLRAS
jgi:uncharacterized membrane protein YkvA (DUF1232 family)